MSPGFGGIIRDSMTLNAMLLTAPDDDEAEAERVRIEQEAQRRLEAALEEQHAHVTAAANTGHDAPREVAARVREAAGNLPSRSATEALRAALAAGADLGVRVAVNGFEPLGIAANWRLVHAQARSWAELYAYDLIRGINATSLDRVSAAVAAWVETGTALDVLIDQLTGVFGPVRAEMIAQTETTRAYAQGSLDAYRASGVVSQMEWLTGNDEFVCPICAPLNGQRTGLDGEFAPGISLPPAHPRCRCRIAGVVDRAD